MADVDALLEDLDFPMIVKHFNSYSSIGMTKQSKVTNECELRSQLSRMLSDYGGALVEEFIAGREFTVLVSENPEDSQLPLAYLPVECQFPSGEEFKHFDLKWHDYDGIEWVPVADDDLAERLKEMAREVYLTPYTADEFNPVLFTNNFFLGFHFLVGKLHVIEIFLRLQIHSFCYYFILTSSFFLVVSLSTFSCV